MLLQRPLHARAGVFIDPDGPAEQRRSICSLRWGAALLVFLPATVQPDCHGIIGIHKDKSQVDKE